MSTPSTQGVIIDRYVDFCNLFHDRLHALLLHTEELEEKSFMLHMDLRPRQDLKALESSKTFLAGADSQRKILEVDLSLTDKEKKRYDPYWEYLKNKHLEIGVPGLETYEVLQKIIENKIRLKDIYPQRLKDYFGPNRKKGIFKNEFQRNEYPIFSSLFDIDNDFYISLPLIQFGVFEGIIHVLFKSSPRDVFGTQRRIKRIIKLFSFQYEDLLLAWEGVGDLKFEYSGEFYNYLLSDEYLDKVQKNPLLKKLGFQRFYKISHPYLQSRIFYNDEIPNIIETYARRIATISILVDSFSHNISAHSLTALNWWFRQRSEWHDLNKALESAKKTNNQTKLQQIEKDLKIFFDSGAHELNPFLDFKGHMSKELYPLLRFLMEKGAFWTGVSRGNNFGGKISNLGRLLWFDFFNNPLYLGTIAYSEGIRKIEVKIIFYDSVSNNISLETERKIAKNEENIELQGEYVRIDLQNRRNPEEQIEQTTRGEFPQMLEECSEFVIPGVDFVNIQRRLNEIRVFLPGGVVGKHGLFTLLENEIRNVKHFEDEVLDEMRENGLKLVLSLMPKPIMEGMGKNALYEMGVWLDHPTILSRKGAEKNEARIFVRYEGANEDIINSNLQPKLGGTSQDKLCAAMLLNNDFQSVQKKKSIRDRLYYPWIFSASSETINPEIDFILGSQYLAKTFIPENSDSKIPVSSHFADEIEISKKYNAFLRLANSRYNQEKGFIKKYFHLWQGADLYHYHSSVDLELENISRFQFVVIHSSDPQDRKAIREAGVIRIIPNARNEEEAWKEWIGKWFPEQEDHIIIFKEKEENGAICCIQGRLEFWSKQKLRDTEIPEHVEVKLIQLAHGGRYSNKPNEWNYRSHGVFINRFCGETKKLQDLQAMPASLLHEFYEALETQIAIFDNRIIKRIPHNKIPFYRENLKSYFFDEKENEWNSFRENKLRNIHFLVLHLSFIERMEDQEGVKYGERRIGTFIEEQILKHIKDRKNFILVITTGRGRKDWWESIRKTEYTLFTTFRPIETLITSIENAVQKKDDFEMKYHLIKTLFGS